MKPKQTYRSRLRVLAVSCAITLSCFGMAEATTIRPLSFDKITERAGIVFEGTVIDLQVVRSGAEAATSAPKQHIAPLQAIGDQSPDSSGNHEAAPAQTAMTIASGAAGGRILLTRVTMSVDREISGVISAPTVSFNVAGGSDGEIRMIVFGMPRFEMGGRYVVFLRPDFAQARAPVVGFNQGHFEIAEDPDGGPDKLLNSKGDIVIGVENDRLVTRRNPGKMNHQSHAHGGDIPRAYPEPAPVPNHGVRVEQARMSPAVERYFFSEEAPMTVATFAQAIRTIKEGKK